jgi:uncharacterized protein YdaU (DUF1376 family)
MAGRFAFMAKDPALLFYTSDFLSGTMLLSMEQRGKYITLLCLQHQTGRLSEKHMLQICGTHDPDIWAKFKHDEAGLFYNERLEFETERRRNYSESRSKNRKGKKKDVNNTSKTYDVHMETETETITESKTKRKRGAGEKEKQFVPPELTEVIQYVQQKGFLSDLAKQFHAYYTENNWVKTNNKRVDNWKLTMQTWMARPDNQQYKMQNSIGGTRYVPFDPEKHF